MRGGWTQVSSRRPCSRSQRRCPRRSRWTSSAGRHRSPRGPTLLARSTDDGASFAPAREIYAPPPGQHTSGNQIVVMPDGDLLNFFEQFGVDTQDMHPRQNTIAVIRSRDHGATWSQPTIIARANVSGVTDPRDGATVRTGDVFPEVAVDERRGRHNVYAVWEDTRFTGGRRHQIAFSRSTHDGRTWSTPTRVSANRAHAGVRARGRRQ